MQLRDSDVRLSSCKLQQLCSWSLNDVFLIVFVTEEEDVSGFTEASLVSIVASGLPIGFVEKMQHFIGKITEKMI